MKKLTGNYRIISYLFCLAFLCGCGTDSPTVPGNPLQDTYIPPVSSAKVDETVHETVSLPEPGISSEPDASAASGEAVASDSPAGSRDNTPHCLVPTADSTAETHNEYASIDYSNAAEGYVMVRYTGPSPKVKLRITGADSVTYTYNLISDTYEAFPLSAGDGSYEILVLENLSGTSYLVCLAADIDVTLTNAFGPYLYPNQYCKFDSESSTVAKAAELARSADSDLDVVSNVYNYIIESITYDYEKAETVPSGYTSDVDEILETGTGICLDYAAVMTSMLRSQRIPTRLEVGYVGEVYHAWVSTYITDIGWVNGIVQFDGQNWKLMDPTFAAGNSEKELKKFIGDGTNYVVKYMY